MSEYQIKKVKVITGQIEVITGLRIGAGQDTMEIGGNDNPILRNPANGEPYIPGSSIKGKMRSLIEWQLGKIVRTGEVWQADENNALTCPITRVFGASASKKMFIGPTRLIVRDAFLSQKFRDQFKSGSRPIVEIKSENTINRLTSIANPRPMERVVPGIQFDFEMVYRIMQIGADDPGNDEQYFTDIVLKGLRLLEMNYLGSAGSRGCGQIKFVNLKDETGSSIKLDEISIN